jgi:hypothetical protein
MASSSMMATSPPPENNSDPPPGRSRWEGSEVIPANIDWITNTQRVSAGVACRLPARETVPAPKPDERVVFVTHFERGFALPVSDLFRDFLDYYDLQPHHLPANATMTLSAFAAFCEGYAGIEPFVQGWSKYFQLRKQSAQEPKDKNAPRNSQREEGLAHGSVWCHHYHVPEGL